MNRNDAIPCVALWGLEKEYIDDWTSERLTGSPTGIELWVHKEEPTIYAQESFDVPYNKNFIKEIKRKATRIAAAEPQFRARRNAALEIGPWDGKLKWEPWQGEKRLPDVNVLYDYRQINLKPKWVNDFKKKGDLKERQSLFLIVFYPDVVGEEK